MSIVFNCPCGRALRVRDESLRGQKVKCPACGALVDVPGEPKRDEKPARQQEQPDQQPASQGKNTAKKESRHPRKPHRHPSRRRRPDRHSRNGLQPQEMAPKVLGGGAGGAAEGSEEKPAKKKGGIGTLFRRLLGRDKGSW